MSFAVIPGRHNRQVELKLSKLAGATRRGIRQGFFDLGHTLERRAKQNIIKGPKTGRLYKIPGRRRKHRASAPGESPANLTGNLQKSVGFQIEGSNSMEFGYRVGGGPGVNTGSAEYGARLELGGGNVKPRPNLSKAVKGTQAQAFNYFQTAVQREIKPQ